MSLNAAEFIENLPPALQKRFEVFCNDIVKAHRSVRLVDESEKSHDPFFAKDCLICCFGEDRSSPQIFIIAPNKLGEFIIKHRPTGSVYVKNLRAISDYQADPSSVAYSGVIAEAALELLSGSNAANEFSPILVEENDLKRSDRGPPSTLVTILALFGVLAGLGGFISLLLDFTDVGAWIALAIGLILIWRTRMA